MFFLRGAIFFVTATIATMLICVIVALIGFLMLMPLGWNKKLLLLAEAFGFLWVRVISSLVHHVSGVRISAVERRESKEGVSDDRDPLLWGQLSKDKSYIILCNHQSWADVVILQSIFLGKAPFLKFFIKDELKWIPFLNLAWWALDFPFMKRYSSDYLKKNPEKAGQDLKTTVKACQRFRSYPTSLVNFVEGTRFTWAKRRLFADRSKPPGISFDYLLPAKAGGVALALEVMADTIEGIIDTTIIYPGVFSSPETDRKDPPTFWQFVSGRVPSIYVDVRSLPKPQFEGSYIDDKTTQAAAREWISSVWKEKDQKIREKFLWI